MKLIDLKGRTKEIELVFKENVSIEKAISELRTLSDSKEFLKSANIRVSYSGVTFSYNEEMRFEKEITEIFGEEASLVKKHKLSIRQINYSLEKTDRICRIVEKSLRSGEEVCFDGDVLIIGDVNPGALVKADGNITVLGALRGSACIKKSGKVYATYMQPTQIRIGKVYSYNKKGDNVGAAIAVAENGEIILECL